MLAKAPSTVTLTPAPPAAPVQTTPLQGAGPAPALGLLAFSLATRPTAAPPPPGVLLGTRAQPAALQPQAPAAPVGTTPLGNTASCQPLRLPPPTPGPIPGPPGPPGPAGPPGAAGATGATGPAGSSASVTPAAVRTALETGGNISVANNYITDVPPPTQNGYAANKEYVDLQIDALGLIATHTDPTAILLAWKGSVVIATGNANVSLPASAPVGWACWVNNESLSNMPLVAPGSETINGGGSYAVAGGKFGLVWKSDSTSWRCKNWTAAG